MDSSKGSCLTAIHKSPFFKLKEGFSLGAYKCQHNYSRGNDLSYGSSLYVVHVH